LGKGTALPHIASKIAEKQIQMGKVAVAELGSGDGLAVEAIVLINGKLGVWERDIEIISGADKFPYEYILIGVSKSN
jgi:hypothetical protein